MEWNDFQFHFHQGKAQIPQRRMEWTIFIGKYENSETILQGLHIRGANGVRVFSFFPIVQLSVNRTKTNEEKSQDLLYFYFNSIIILLFFCLQLLSCLSKILYKGQMGKNIVHPHIVASLDSKFLPPKKYCPGKLYCATEAKGYCHSHATDNPNSFLFFP